MCGGTTTNVTEVDVPPPTAAELEFQNKQLELAQSQLDALNQAGAFQKEQFEAFAPLIEQTAEQGAKQLELMDLALEEAKVALGAAGTPEEREARQQQLVDLSNRQIEL